MTYDEIVQKLQSLRLDYLLGALTYSVGVECNDIRKAAGERKQTQRFLNDTLAQAKANLAEDITKFLTMGDGELTADMVIANPRVAMAWAVSQKLRGDNLRCPECRGPLTYQGEIIVFDYVRQKYYLTKLYSCSTDQTNPHTLYRVLQEVSNA